MSAIRTNKQSGTATAKERAEARRASFEQEQKAKIDAATERRRASATGEFANAEKPAKGRKTKEVQTEQPAPQPEEILVEEVQPEPQGEGDLGV